MVKGLLRRMRFFMLAAFLLGGSVAFLGCGKDLPGTIELLELPTTVAATALAMLRDKSGKGLYLYLVDENGKFFSYDLKDPAKPKKLQQLDAFKGPHQGMFLFGNNDRIMLLGKNGKVTVFDISDPAKPTTMWGGGKTVDLGVKAGPYIKYSSASALYMTLPDTAIVRIDLTTFSNPDITKVKPKESMTKIAGSGGGGLAIIYDDKGSPVRLYVAHSGSNKVDVWIVADIEGGNAKPKPSSSFEIKSLKKITALYPYKEHADDVKGWLMAASEASEETDYVVLDLGLRWKNAASPTEVGKANIDGLYRFGAFSKILVTEKLNIWDFSEDKTKPVKVAQPTLREEADLRDMVINGNYIYTAEKGGLRVYRYDKGAATTK